VFEQVGLTTFDHLYLVDTYILYWSSIGGGATGAAASIRVSSSPVPCLPTTLPNEVG
jgi:hypothetical protein